MAVHPHLHSNHSSRPFYTFFITPLLFYQENAPPNDAINSKLPVQWRATSLSSCGFQPLKCQFTASLCNILSLYYIFVCPLISHVSILLYCISHCLYLSLVISVTHSPSPLFGLQADVFDPQRRRTGLNDGFVNGVTDNSTN